MAIPWPTKLSVYVTTLLHGYDEVGRAMRRTIVRYVNLSLCMVLRVLSPRVKRRFPKMDDLIIAGLINENELSILQNLERKYPGMNSAYWSLKFVKNLWKYIHRLQQELAADMLGCKSGYSSTKRWTHQE